MANQDEWTIEPVPGLAPWFGGKRNLAKQLVGRIESVPHSLYVEPFAGMGGVFLRRRRRVKVEVINDYSGDVVNLFRVVKHHSEPLLEELRYQFHSRPDFERLVRVDPVTLTDIQRAARFYVIQRLNYGGLPLSRCFPATKYRHRWLGSEAVRAHIERVAHRLELVTIENLDFAACLRRYDCAEALFYIDPPYFGNEVLYGAGLFERADFERLAAALKGLRGRFILSLNDVPEIRETFAEFAIEEIDITYKICANKRVTELLITGGGSPCLRHTARTN